MSVLAVPQDAQELLSRVRVQRRARRLRRAIYWWPVAVLLVIAFVAAFLDWSRRTLPTPPRLGRGSRGPDTAPATPTTCSATDDLGRDLLSRVIWGARAPVVVALAAVLLAGIVGPRSA